MKTAILTSIICLVFFSIQAQAPFPFKDENEKYGIKDENGKIIVPGKYEVIEIEYDYTGGIMAVMLNDKWGFVDRTGKEITTLKYDYTYPISEYPPMDGLIAVNIGGKFDEESYMCIGGKWGFIDTTGREVVPCKYDWVYEYSEGFAAVNIGGVFEKEAGEYGDFRGGKWGYIDKTGKEVIPLKYDDVWAFIEGISAVSINGKWGAINRAGKIITPLKYDYVEIFYDNSDEFYFRVNIGGAYEDDEYLMEGGKWGAIDRTTGKEITRVIYDDMSHYSSEGLILVNLDEKYGFIDKTGKIVIPIVYDYAASFINGSAHVGQNGRYFYIDKTGKEVK